jgi:hypothetical protein
MTYLDYRHLAGSALALLLVAASPVNAPRSGVLTLVSPNGQGGDFGYSVAGTGDVNQDGSADVIVGSFLEFVGRGRAYVFSGPDGKLLYELVSPNEEQAGWFGYSVAGAGDVNRDGFADVVVGAALEDTYPSAPDGGRAYVFSGRDGALLLEFVSPNDQARLGRFGHSVAGASDLNNDGFPDLLIGASSEETDTSPTSAGRAYVFSGQDGSLLHTFVGDINADGVGDLLVGALNEEPGAQGGCRPQPCPVDAGRAYVFSGHDGSLLLDLLSPNPEERGEFGVDVASAGDVNQDGSADVIVGADHEDPGTSPDDAGRVYVFSGQDGSLLAELASPNEAEIGQFGRSVASAGDLDQDGLADLIVGAYGENRAYVFSGNDMGLLFELASPNPQPNGFFAWSVGAAGDADGDGTGDLIVGAWGEGPGGRAYVFLSDGTFRINSGGLRYTDTAGRLFVADRAYAPGGFGYVGGLEHTFNQPIGGTDDDPLYQDVRVAREGSSDGIFAYRFDVASPARYDVTLYLMAPALEGTGNVVMNVQAEEDLAFDDLDVTVEAGGEYQALLKTFAVDVNDGTLDLRFRAVSKAAVISAIAVAAQTEAHGSRVARRPSGGK